MEILIIIAIAIFLVALAARILIPLGILLFIPADPRAVRQIVSLARVKSGEKAVDLGAGDGRVVIALALAGAEAHGYEINPFLILRARRAIQKAGLEGRAFIHFGNFFFKNLRNFDIITIYISPFVMKLFEAKAKRELRPDGRIISFRFPFPHWRPSQVIGDFYLYRK